MPEKTSNAPSKLPGSSTPHYYPIRFEATHKKAFGGCTGQLELTTTDFISDARMRLT